MTRAHILVVDDERDIRELVQYNLEKDGYQVSAAATGEDALKQARARVPDLVVLDLMLPGIDGLEVCKILKNDSATKDVSVLMLTAKGEEADIVAGLELGADDYVTKPFSPRVLLARVKAMLRRAPAETDAHEKPIHVQGISVDPSRHEVTHNHRPVSLTSSEFRLIQMLASRPGRVFTRDQIIDRVHGMDYAVTSRSVDVLVAGLRKKLGNAGKLIETVRGVGYRMKE